jgi:DNA-binding CsgD family transcriptional regulator
MDSQPGADFAARLSEVIGSVYDCALDPARWPEALAAIGTFIGGNRVRLFLFNSDAALPGDGESIGVDRAFNRAFDHDAETLASIKYAFVVAELDKAVTFAEILGISGGRDVNGRLPHDNRFWREWMAPRQAHDALAVLALKTSGRFGGLAMTRSLPLPPFGREEKQKMALVAPHVRRALTISDLVGQRNVAQSVFSEVIDALAVPIVIVDRMGAIEHANTAAAQLIESGVLPTQNGTLRMIAGSGRGAAQRGEEESGAWTVPVRDAEGAELIATVLPLGLATGASQGARAVFLHRVGEPAQLPGEGFARLYGLTGTELRIAMLLAEGAGVTDIAERLGSTLNTVRWHLKNLRAKTGTSRIGEVALLASRAVSPVLRNRLAARAEQSSRPKPSVSRT